jgi:hypothetical protein
MVIRAILDKRKANKDGLFPVKIRISDKGAAVHESTGIYATPDEFDEHRCSIKIRIVIGEKLTDQPD